MNQSGFHGMSLVAFEGKSLESLSLVHEVMGKKMGKSNWKPMFTKKGGKCLQNNQIKQK